MLRPGRFFYPYIIITSFSLVLAAINGNPYYYRASFLWIIVLVVSFIWSYINLSGLQVTRTLRERRIEFGQLIYESYFISNTSRIGKIQLEIEDRSKLTSGISSRIITYLAPHATQTFSTMIKAERRGLYELGPTIVKSTDIFGLFTREITFPPEDSVIVRPLVLDINIEPVFKSYRRGGKRSDERREYESILPSSIRDHHPGDSLKRIHWPSTAKHQHLMVREYDSEPQADGFIILNCFKGSLSNEIPKTRTLDHLNSNKEKLIEKEPMEYLVCIAASIARRLLRGASDVGLFANNSALDILAPDQGDRQYNKVLDILSLINSDGTMPLREFYLRIRSSIPKGSKLYILSSFGEDDLPNLIKEIKANGYYLELVVVKSDDQVYEHTQMKLVLDNASEGNFRLITMDGKVSSLQDVLNAEMYTPNAG